MILLVALQTIFGPISGPTKRLNLGPKYLILFDLILVLFKYE